MVTNIVLLDPRNRENIATVLRNAQNMHVSLQQGIREKYLENNANTAHLKYLKIPAPKSLDPGVCASIVMYDRGFCREGLITISIYHEY